MAATLAVVVDVIHAASMVAWIVGLPFLVWRRWPKATRAFAIYAIVFVVANRLSHWALGECFLTTLARSFWRSDPGPAPPDVDEWFTVRFATAVFRLTPSHRAVVWSTELMILATSILVLRALRPTPAPTAVGGGRAEEVGRRSV